MKKSKKIFIIILSVLVVIFSLTTYVLSLVRLGVLCPAVYSSFMPRMNAFDSLYEGFTEYLLSPLETMEIPEEIEGVPEDLVAIAISEKDFNSRVGKAIGGGIGWLLYNHPDVEIPLKYFSDSLKSTLQTDERVLNSETNIMATMEAIAINRIEIFIPPDEYEQNFRGYLYYYLAGTNEQFRDTYDYWVDVFFYYYGVRLSIFTAISFALLIVFFTALLIVARGNRQSPIKLSKVLCIVYGTINAIISGVLFLFPVIAANSERLASFSEFIPYFKGLTNSFAVLALIYAVVLILAAIALGKIQRNIHSRKTI